ncbi:MAG: cytochrome-c oxidase, cbb3-type subunit III [bacterium]
MADFTSEFWSWFIIIPTLGGIVFLFWLIWWQTMDKSEEPKDGEAESTGHVWDEDLQELNNPMPKWWLNMFYITLVFGIGYLVLYPGLGSFQGVLDWSQTAQYEQEVDAADKKFGPLFNSYLAQPLGDVALDPKAQKMGERLYASYCAVCHGSDARGARGFPNLRDGDWLWGGEPEAIKVSIMDGRTGNMPAWEGPLGGEAGVNDVTQYVLQLASRKHDADAATRGQEKYTMFCVGCHGVEGKGNTMLGAPNLTDSAWLYGGSSKAISESIAKGRIGRMPAHKEFLGEAKVHLLAAYIYGLRGEGGE